MSQHKKGVADSAPTRATLFIPPPDSAGMDTSNTYVNALLGAVVSVVLSFLPFSPALGGAVAGYLERADGIRVGAIAGVFAAIPQFLFLLVFGGVATAFLGFGGDAFAGGFVLLLFVIVVFLAIYTVALSALGGLVGVYLADEFRDRPVVEESPLGR